jgi:glutamyl-tRNA reductase
VPHAEHLAASVDDADATGLDALPESVADADVVVTATGSDAPLLDDGIDAAAARDTLIVDIAQPRDVAQAVAEREGVDYVGLGAVEDVTDGTRERRAEAADTVERLVDREFDRLLDQFKRRRADEAIAAMHESADRLKRREVTTAITRLESAGDLTERQREVVESLGDALVGKLLAPPTTSLREAAVADDWDTIRTALDLFDPDFEDGGGPPDAIPAGAPADAVPDDIDADGPPEWVDAGEPPDD